MRLAFAAFIGGLLVLIYIAVLILRQGLPA